MGAMFAPLPTSACLTFVPLLISNPATLFLALFLRLRRSCACELRFWDWELWARRWPRIW